MLREQLERNELHWTCRLFSSGGAVLRIKVSLRSGTQVQVEIDVCISWCMIVLITQRYLYTTSLLGVKKATTQRSESVRAGNAENQSQTNKAHKITTNLTKRTAGIRAVNRTEPARTQRSGGGGITKKYRPTKSGSWGSRKRYVNTETGENSRQSNVTAEWGWLNMGVREW
jgi:hypothetical protein